MLRIWWKVLNEERRTGYNYDKWNIYPWSPGTTKQSPEKSGRVRRLNIYPWSPVTQFVCNDQTSHDGAHKHFRSNNILHCITKSNHLVNIHILKSWKLPMQRISTKRGNCHIVLGLFIYDKPIAETGHFWQAYSKSHWRMFESWYMPYG